MDEDEYVSIGSADYLSRLLREYGLTRRQVDHLVIRNPLYSIHHSVLRSQGEFGCAGDAEALRFCREIAEYMVQEFGIRRREAVGRVNEAWANPEHRNWIVGDDIAYHETAGYWAKNIYYGPDWRWQTPKGQQPTPVPFNEDP